MTKVNLILSDYLTGIKDADEEKLKAAHSIKKLLEKIDYKSEVVPENNLEMFARLLFSLKGAPLSKEEIQLAREIIMN